MILYRVENLNTGIGLWYNTKDNLESNIVHDLNLSGKYLPMFYDEELSKFKWKSATDSIDQLRIWFTKEDLIKLIPLGFNLYEINCDIVRQHITKDYEHPLYQEIGIKSRKELDIGILYDKT